MVVQRVPLCDQGVDDDRGKTAEHLGKYEARGMESAAFRLDEDRSLSGGDHAPCLAPPDA